MKNMHLVLIAVVLSVVAYMWFSHNSKSIVVLDGYEHAVAICEKNNQTGVVRDDEFTMIIRPSFFVTVNPGHEGDIQVRNLMVKAVIQCGG